jgi:signal transduction histidine kinase
LSDWDAFQKNKLRLENELFLPLHTKLDDLISSANMDYANVNRRRRVINQLENDKKTVQKRGSLLKREVNEQINLFHEELNETLQKKLTTLNDVVENILVDFERTDESFLEDEELSKKHRRWEKDIDIAMENTDQYLSTLRDRLKDLTGTLRRGEILDVDTLGAVENQSEAYKSQLDTYFEFAQIGMAVGIVQHEFSSTIKQIRGCIKQLKPWADGTPELKILYGDMRHNFEHLDSYLTLFAPLNRRLHRSAKDISGYEILRYLTEIFGERFERHGIRLNHSSKFDDFSINAYPSTIFPAFVNIIDNAVYWLNQCDIVSKDILLDVDECGFLISNNGPKIEYKDAEAIFDFGVSRKSGGRGMGLYISRESLRRDGMDLILIESGLDQGVLFKITAQEIVAK